MQSPPEPNKPSLYKMNPVVNTPMVMGRIEALIFIHILSSLKYRKWQTNLFRISLIEVLPYAAKGGFDYQRVQHACSQLLERAVNLAGMHKEEGDLNLCNLIEWIQIRPKDLFIEGKVTDTILPILDALYQNDASDFQAIFILMQLQTKYTRRLFWLLNFYKENSIDEISLSNLRALLFIEEESDMYPQYYDFKRFVFEPTLKELHLLGWDISITEVKQSRKVIGLRFILPAIPKVEKNRNL